MIQKSDCIARSRPWYQVEVIQMTNGEVVLKGAGNDWRDGAVRIYELIREVDIASTVKVEGKKGLNAAWSAGVVYIVLRLISDLNF